MPTLEPRLAGLTNTGKPSLVAIVVHRCRARRAASRAPENDVVVADRQAVGGEDQLHRRFVHADRGREHAGADVGHVRELEQPLHRCRLRRTGRAARETPRRVRVRRRRAPFSRRSTVSSVSPPGCATRCASRGGLAEFLFGGLDDVGGDGDRRRARRKRPTSVLFDEDRAPEDSARDRGFERRPRPTPMTLRARLSGRRK